jgi:dCTP diphosphatase
MPHSDLDTLKQQLRTFAAERDWEQFHSPKNLSMALAVEAAELMEIFQWISEAQSKNLDPEHQAQAEEEVADVLLYLVRLADTLGIDLLEAAERKLACNAEKYPKDKAVGRADKYTKYQE